MSKLYVVVDMQEDFVNGVFGTDEARAIVPHIKTHLNTANKDDIILFTKDTHTYFESIEGDTYPKHCVKHSRGWGIIDELVEYTTFSNAYVLEKDSFMVDPFVFDGWMDKISFEKLQEIDGIYVMGVCTDICVLNTALLLRRVFVDKKIYVPSDCCVGTTPEKHKATLEILKGSCIGSCY